MCMIDGIQWFVCVLEMIFDSVEFGLEEFGFNIFNVDLNCVLVEVVDNEINFICFDDVVMGVDFSGD